MRNPFYEGLAECFILINNPQGNPIYASDKFLYSERFLQDFKEITFPTPGIYTFNLFIATKQVHRINFLLERYDEARHG